MQWQVDDVMTHEVITVGADTPVDQIAGLLDREGISAVPVTTETGDVLGVVSQVDLLAGAPDEQQIHHRRDHAAGKVRAGDLMTTPVFFIDADASLAVVGLDVVDVRRGVLIERETSGRSGGA